MPLGVFQQALTAGIATADQAARAQRDPLAGLDRTTIVCCGLKGWSYVDAAGAPLPVTVKAIADIDDEALEFLAVEIMKLTKPALFQAPAEVEAARKNG